MLQTEVDDAAADPETPQAGVVGKFVVSGSEMPQAGVVGKFVAAGSEMPQAGVEDGSTGGGFADASSDCAGSLRADVVVGPAIASSARSYEATAVELVNLSEAAADKVALGAGDALDFATRTTCAKRGSLVKTGMSS